MTTTELLIKRMQPPAVPTTENGTVVSVHYIYAEVTCAGITAEVERFSYWEPSDNRRDVEVTFEVRINGLPDHCGTCDVYAEDAETLRALTAVAARAALLLDEVRQQHGERSVRRWNRRG
jgi:hypothetical protein